MTAEDIKVGMCFIGGESQHIRQVLEIGCRYDGGGGSADTFRYSIHKKTNDGTYRTENGSFSEHADRFISEYIDDVVHTFVNESGNLEIL